MKKIYLSIALSISMIASAWSQSRKLAEKQSTLFGLNMAGADFGENMPGIYGTDYYYPEAKDMDHFAEKGFKLFRLPFRWERVQPEAGGKLDLTELGRMKTFMKEAEKRGIWVFLDMHNYVRRKINGEYKLVGTAGITSAQLADVWMRLATEFKGFSNLYGYGIMNEPHDMPANNSWSIIAQEIIYAIRRADKKTPILVSGNHFSSAERWMDSNEDLVGLKDPANQLIFEAHLYFDRDGSGSYKYSYEVEKANENTGVERLKPFVNWLKKYNKKGLVGEYGIPDNDERWLKVLNNLLVYMSENNLSGTYWAAGPWWGDNHLAVQPIDGKDRPQMKVLEKFTKLPNKKP